jgi:hypothetical protein
MIRTSTKIVGALALAGALMSNGPVSAAQPGAVMEGDLNQPRTIATVDIPVDCDAAQTNQTKTATLSVKIFQSVGRLLNIGTGSADPTCTGSPVDYTVAVTAIQGLKFQPGPATILIKLTETITTTTPNANPLLPPDVTVNVVETESGARINLKP